MPWNYRVLREDLKYPRGGEETRYAVCEVYYSDTGRIEGWTEPCYPSGETLEECSADLAMMARALTMPVIDVSSGKPVEVSPNEDTRDMSPNGDNR